MGVFDFLYKTKPKREPVPRRYYQKSYENGSKSSSNNPHHHNQERTTTYVKRTNSLPDEIDKVDEVGEKYSGRRNRASHHDSNHHKHHKSQQQSNIPKKLETTDFQSNKFKTNGLQHDDDYTRLGRLETKIDNYITRQDDLIEELQNINKNLNLIHKEFYEEFNDEILPKNDKYIVELGQRILAKLESFSENKTKDNPTKVIESVILQPKFQSKEISLPYQKSNESRKIVKNEVFIPINPQSPRIASPQQHHHHHHINNEKDQQVLDSQTNYKHYGNTIFENSTNNNNNGDSNDVPSTYTMARAKYAIVNSSTPISHYKSTPTLAENIDDPYNEYEPQDNNRFALDETSIHYSPTSNQQKSRVYLNMSMAMHSDHPVIEQCFRRIELLRPRIIHYRSDHKLRVYKEFNSEITSLFQKLSLIDCRNDVMFNREKNVALSELHNLAGALERSIECRDPECVVCNSFIYKPEVSV